jgi:poly(3-hydroxybutyrate) depolymerase
MNPLLFPYVEQQFKRYREYPKPAFDILETLRDGKTVPVSETILHAKPFCELINFVASGNSSHERVLIVAPLSGHYAALLRETVRSFLPDFDVVITDWRAAQYVPLAQGAFTLDDYVGYVREFIELLGDKPLHIVAVCQPAVPVFAALSLQAQHKKRLPHSSVFIGGPIDARINPTEVNKFATSNSLEWFKGNTIHTVPPGLPGKGRRVYPGFLQYAGFVQLDPQRHLEAERKFRSDLLQAALEHDPEKKHEFSERAEKYRRFYDDYCAVMDVPSEYYLDTIKVAFKEFELARGVWEVNGERVDPSAITQGKLIVLEGENDNIVGIGQTKAALVLASGLPSAKKVYELAEGVGHYGIFSGWTFRDKIYPKIREAMLA